jgi:hypothetical protein
MPTKDGITYSMSTEWAVEVFDWDQETPQDNGGALAATDLWGSTSFGKMGTGGGATNYAYLDKDILTSIQQSALNKFGAAGKALKNLFGAASGAKASEKQGFSDAFEAYGDVKRRSSGVVSIHFSRGKNKVDNKCTITVVGPLPAHTRSGNWVIVSSIHASDEALSSIPRFMGQIQQIDTEYNVLSSGSIVLRSTITVNEWSNLFLTPIVFDMRTAAGFMNSSPSSIPSLAGVLAGGVGESYDEYLKALQQNLNPYTAAKYFLKMIGLINELGGITLNEKSPYKTAASMPDLPKSFLERLGHSGSTAEVFSKGFVKIITGRVKDPSVLEPVSYKGLWSGFFSEKTLTFDNYMKSYSDFKGEDKLQPVASGITSLAQIGNQSVWDLVQSTIDPQFNEAFTDMYYEIDGEGNIGTNLAVVVRGKMFKTKSAEEAAFDNDNGPTEPKISIYGNSMISEMNKPPFRFGQESESTSDPAANFSKMAENALKDIAAEKTMKAMTKMSSIKAWGSSNAIYPTWNYYEDIPRIYVDGSLITGMTLSNTFMTTPNLFFLGYSGSPDRLLTATMIDFSCMGSKRHNGEMLRFGSNIIRILTKFLHLPSGGNTVPDHWYETMMKLIRVWDGYNYRMASGVIRIKDPGIPLSIGMNIQFDLSGEFYVAHIDGIDVTFMITPDGVKSTQTSIRFSRLMKDDGNGRLKFCAASMFGDLWQNNAHKSERSKTFSAVEELFK